MIASRRVQRRYDHRLREVVRSTGNIDYALTRGVPRSTARGWIMSSTCDVVTVDDKEADVVQLQREVLDLQRRANRLVAIIRLLVVVLKMSGFSFERNRIPDGIQKRVLLKTIDRSRTVLSLRRTLRVVGLSAARYYAWKREEDCELDDRTSCPRSSPHQLTAAQVSTIKEMVSSNDYRHVPTGTLALLAQRLGKVFASSSTWYRLVRLHDWRRPRNRVHPAKPKLGIRASQPNEIWHVDTTLIRLLDGSRAYVHAVIDNFSRRILSWKVSESFDPAITAELLLRASWQLIDTKPTLLADGGVENFNGAVDELIDSGLLKRLLAQTEISYSNSLIESWWRVLKHQWLFLNSLDTVSTVRKLVEFYVEQHNTELPHSAFQGQTPDEMYYGTGEKIPEELEESRRSARESRMKANRIATCAACVEV